jgi:hypothetical protein
MQLREFYKSTHGSTCTYLQVILRPGSSTDGRSNQHRLFLRYELNLRRLSGPSILEQGKSQRRTDGNLDAGEMRRRTRKKFDFRVKASGIGIEPEKPRVTRDAPSPRCSALLHHPQIRHGRRRQGRSRPPTATVSLCRSASALEVCLL